MTSYLLAGLLAILPVKNAHQAQPADWLLFRGVRLETRFDEQLPRCPDDRNDIKKTCYAYFDIVNADGENRHTGRIVFVDELTDVFGTETFQVYLCNEGDQGCSNRLGKPTMIVLPVSDVVAAIRVLSSRFASSKEFDSSEKLSLHWKGRGLHFWLRKGYSDGPPYQLSVSSDAWIKQSVEEEHVKKRREEQDLLRRGKGL